MKPSVLHQRAVLYTMAAAIVVGVASVLILRPKPTGVWVAVVILGPALVASVMSFVLAKWRNAGMFAARETLSEEQIYSQYFAQSGISASAVRELWHEVAETLHVPAEKLRPSDRFGHELGGYWISSDELDALARRAAKRSSQLDLAEIKTLGEYVHRLAVAKTR
jgi:hypothetical protein